jgi:hemoglobin
MIVASSRAFLLAAFLLCVSFNALAREPLYERLGGDRGVNAIASALIDRLAVDPVTSAPFEHTRLDRIKRLIAEQLCELTQGPCRYSGDSMKRSHAGLHISQAMFYRTVETLRAVLHERQVDERSTNELLRLLAPMKRDIVEHAPRTQLPPAPGEMDQR